MLSAFCDRLGPMRVMGIDCGSEYTGFGVVEQLANRELVRRVSGAIKLKTKDAMPLKLRRIYVDLTTVIHEYQPEFVAIEDVFYAVNVKSALKLGQIRGVAMLAASSCGLEVAEYAPLAIKSAVVGYGRADKQPVQYMVMQLLKLNQIPEPADAADALAISICHLPTSPTMVR